MKVPLTVADYLRRAELVYPDRIGVVDEPDQPAASWGALTYREVAERARAQAAALDELGDRPRRAGGHRQPELRPPAHQLLRRERLRSHPRARELPAQRRRGRLHRRALGGLDPAGRPGAGRGARGRDGQAALRARRRERRRAVPLRRGARAVDARRGRHRHHQLHQRHHGPPQGRRAHPSQPLDQRRHLRLADGRQRPRRVPAHPPAVPLQRLGDGVRRHRHGRAAHRAAQGRRRGDPAADRRARGDLAVRRPGGRGDGARRRGDVGRTDPWPRPCADGRGRRAAAHPDHRADGVRPRLGVRPDLRAHRDGPAAHDEPAPRRVRRPLALRPGRPARAGGGAGARHRARRGPVGARCWPAAT